MYDPLTMTILAGFGLVLLTLVGCFPWTLIAYGVVAWVAKPKPEGNEGVGGFVPRRSSAREVRDSMRDIDRRMAEVETYVTAPNTGLAREIESLR